MNKDLSFNPSLKTWFITGASSGIGQQLALAALRRGDRVAAASRTLQGTATLQAQFPDQVLALAFDVQDAQAVQQAVQQAQETFGRLDVVANNAGYGLFGGVEEATDQQARAIFDTNLFGALNVLRAVLPILRQQAFGHILQGSSVYGLTAHAGVGLLAATKHALEGLTDALLQEVGPLGIRVTLIEPGMTRTAFLSRLEVARPIADYDGTVRQVQQAIGNLPAEAFLEPAELAAQVLAAVDSPEPPARLLIGNAALSQATQALQARLSQVQAAAQPV